MYRKHTGTPGLDDVAVLWLIVEVELMVEQGMWASGRAWLALTGNALWTVSCDAGAAVAHPIHLEKHAVLHELRSMASGSACSHDCFPVRASNDA